MNFVLVNDGQPSRESRPAVPAPGHSDQVTSGTCRRGSAIVTTSAIGNTSSRRADVVAILAALDSIDVKERCRVATAGGRGDRHVGLHSLLELHHTHGRYCDH